MIARSTVLDDMDDDGKTMDAYPCPSTTSSFAFLRRRPLKIMLVSPHILHDLNGIGASERTILTV
jgi:hypothetical protein